MNNIFKSNPIYSFKGKVIYTDKRKMKIVFTPDVTLSRSCDFIIIYKVFDELGREGTTAQKFKLNQSAVKGKKYVIKGNLNFDRVGWEKNCDVSDAGINVFNDGEGNFNEKFLGLMNDNPLNIEHFLNEDRSFKKFEDDFIKNLEEGLKISSN